MPQTMVKILHDMSLEEMDAMWNKIKKNKKRLKLIKNNDFFKRTAICWLLRHGCILSHLLLIITGAALQQRRCAKNTAKRYSKKAERFCNIFVKISLYKQAY